MTERTNPVDRTRPQQAKVIIRWTDKYGEVHRCEFDQKDLESAHDLIGVWIGDLSKEDLKA